MSSIEAAIRLLSFHLIGLRDICSYSERLAAFADRLAQSAAGARDNDDFFLGFFVTNEPRWSNGTM